MSTTQATLTCGRTSTTLPVPRGARATLPAGHWVVTVHGVVAPAELNISGPGVKADGDGWKSGTRSLEAVAGQKYGFSWRGGTYSVVEATLPAPEAHLPEAEPPAPPAPALNPLRLMLPYVDGWVTAPALAKAVAASRATWARTWHAPTGSGGVVGMLRTTGIQRIVQTWTPGENLAAFDVDGTLAALDFRAVGTGDVVQWGNEFLQISRYQPKSVAGKATDVALRFGSAISRLIGPARTATLSYLPHMDSPDCRLLKSMRDAGLLDPAVYGWLDCHFYIPAGWTAAQIRERMATVQSVTALPILSTEAGLQGVAASKYDATFLAQIDVLREFVSGPFAPFGMLGTGGKWDAAFPPVIAADGSVARPEMLAAMTGRANV